MPRRYLATQQVLREWDTLLVEGTPYSEIGRTYGVQEETVARHLPGRGMSPKEKGVLGNAVRVANAQARKQGGYV